LEIEEFDLFPRSALEGNANAVEANCAAIEMLESFDTPAHGAWLRQCSHFAGRAGLETRANRVGSATGETSY
jgi:hypothetical protein